MNGQPVCSVCRVGLTHFSPTGPACTSCYGALQLVGLLVVRGRHLPSHWREGVARLTALAEDLLCGNV
eukprot:13402631-Alexandrium_andersonii.AAC.1